MVHDFRPQSQGKLCTGQRIADPAKDRRDGMDHLELQGTGPGHPRQYGPMAQDFYKVFGRDAIGTIGNKTKINTGDFMGVKLIGTQTLEHRTDRLEEENEQLKIKINTSRKNYREPRGN